MRAIIIDPFTETVTEADVPPGSSVGLRCAVFGARDPACITRTGLGGGIDIWLDDEGLLREDRTQRFFHFDVIRPATAMAGRGVLVAVTRDGETIGLPTAVSVDDVRKMVVFDGDDDGLEQAIATGSVSRPASVIRSIEDGVETVTPLWEWHPSPKAEEQVAN